MDLLFRNNFYKKIYDSKTISLLDFINSASYDELLEIDFLNDTFKQFYHIENKYIVPYNIKKFSEIHDFTLMRSVHPDDRQIYQELMELDTLLERLKNNEIPNFLSGIFRCKLLNGNYRYVEQCLITGEENGLKEGIIRLYVFDVQNYVARQFGPSSEETSIVFTEKDELTGLLTSGQFLAQANEVLKKYEEKNWCLFTLDIENFTFFNEWFGRDKGDVLLSKVGKLFLEYEKQYGGIAGYLGGDDFAMLTIFDMDVINDFFEKVKSVVVSFGLSFGFIPTIGVAKIERGMLISDVFDRANIAAKKAKADVKNRVVLYKSEIRYKRERENMIISSFMKAFKNHEVTFYLQPQCRISTGQIVGAEALARGIRTNGEIITPDRFIPLLEKYGFITDLDQYIWEEVCKWLRKWIDEGHKPVPISVNVSRIDILSFDVHECLRNLTKKYNLPHKLIKVEITESAYADNTSVIESLVERLRKDKFLVLMDDFGSGYSSLNMLSNLSVDAIKLDSAFLIFKNEESTRGIHILESVVNMTKQIAVPTIVEGVETENQSNFLEELGCRYAQGYYFYRPMPVEEFENLIRDESRIDDRGFVVKLNEQFRIREFLDKNVYSDTMLNGIIGPVAIYSWHDDIHIDIVRFNELFYEAVNVPGFHSRLTNIDQFMPDEDKISIYSALKEAMSNKLTGSNAILRFMNPDGTYAFFNIHFYYIGKKDGGERFYGSATNISELMEYVEENNLNSKYRRETMVFVRKSYENYEYSVSGYGLCDALGLTKEEIEKELNRQGLSDRIVNKSAFITMDEEITRYYKEKKNFFKDLIYLDKEGKEKKTRAIFIYTNDESSNIVYIIKFEEVK